MSNAVYIITNSIHSVLYTGVTSNLPRRINEHKEGLVDGFTKRYKTSKLVYAEVFENIKDAIRREKCIKKWNKNWKIELIEKSNPQWKEISPF